MVNDVRLFVVRVWQRLGLFHAVAQPAEGGPACQFDRADDLARFLQASAHAPSRGDAVAGDAPADGSGSRRTPAEDP